MTTKPVTEALVDLIRPQRRSTNPPVEDDQYFAMLWRLVRAAEARVIERPEGLPQLVALQQRLGEAANVVIAVNAARYGTDPRQGASMAECGRALVSPERPNGISKQSASERRARGEEIIAARVAAAGATRFSEAKRERETIEAATEVGVISLADYRARHQAA